MTTQTIQTTQTPMVGPVAKVEILPDDTCDMCGPKIVANTAVRLKSGKKLTFCNHCYREHEAGLASVVVAVLQREVR